MYVLGLFFWKDCYVITFGVSIRLRDISSLRFKNYSTTNKVMTFLLTKPHVVDRLQGMKERVYSSNLEVLWMCTDSTVAGMWERKVISKKDWKEVQTNKSLHADSNSCKDKTNKKCVLYQVLTTIYLQEVL